MAASDPTQLPDDVPEQDVDALYGLPLDEFTPARDALVKQLRGDGRRAAADWVKGLKKPSATAWLVNQLARTQSADAQRVIDSGEAVRAAQDRAIAGKGKAGELGAATEEHGTAMRALLAKAPGLLDRQGRSPSATTLDRAADTLRAIPLDDEARAGFASGRLTRERQASGLGFSAGTSVPPAAARKRSGAARTQEKERKARAQAALKDAKAKYREQGQKVAELERALASAERELKKAASALDRARVEQAKSQARLEEAEAAATQ
jgi:DNA repair exonuclease SbcCD ATPase subunit